MSLVTWPPPMGMLSVWITWPSKKTAMVVVPPRMAAGTLRLHAELERELAKFLGTADALVYPSGYHANTGLFESLLTDRRVVRFIHGYGTGQLKRALAGFLQQHPLVARFATAPPEQGGGGVTVVELKD